MSVQGHAEVCSTSLRLLDDHPSVLFEGRFTIILSEPSLKPGLLQHLVLICRDDPLKRMSDYAEGERGLREVSELRECEG